MKYRQGEDARLRYYVPGPPALHTDDLVRILETSGHDCRVATADGRTAWVPERALVPDETLRLFPEFATPRSLCLFEQEAAHE